MFSFNRQFCRVFCTDALPCSFEPRGISFFVLGGVGNHLGDELFLGRACESLNTYFEGPNKILCGVVLANKYNSINFETSCDLILVVDFACQVSLFFEEMVAAEISKILNRKIFRWQKRGSAVVLSTEIRSSPIRILGLTKQLTKTAKIFHENGIEVVHIGKDPINPTLSVAKYVSKSVVGLEECEKEMYSSRTAAFLGFDNFWMHKALATGLRCYVCQRRKFLRSNLFNHITMINRFAAVDDSKIVYIT